MVTETGTSHRVWVFAAMVTGSAHRADEVTAAVLGAHRDLDAVGESRLYRRVVNLCRETSAGADAGGEPWRADLPPRQREALVLRHAVGFDTLPASQAAGLDLKPFESVLAEAEHALGGADAAAAEVSQQFDHQLAQHAESGVQRAETLASGARTRRRVVTLAQFLLFFVGVGLIVFVMLDLANWDDEQAERLQQGEQFSNPLPATDQQDEGSPR